MTKRPPLPQTHGTCRHCAAWAEVHASHCPVCGIVAPLATNREWHKLFGSWSDAGRVIGAVVGLGVGLAGAALIPHFTAAWFAGALLCAGSVLAGSVVGMRWLPAWAARKFDGRKPQSLLAVRDALQERIAALTQAGQRIGTLRGRISSSVPASQADPALAVLEAAAQACLRQQERCNADSWRVALAQWQNQLQPALAGWRLFDAAAAEAELVRVDRAAAELQRLRANWQHNMQAHSEAGAAVLVHAEKLANACDALKRTLLLRQALSLAATAPGIDQAFSKQTTPDESMDQLDVLRQSHAFGDFLTSPAAAKDEAVRLNSEQQAVRELERMLGQPGAITGH